MKKLLNIYALLPISPLMFALQLEFLIQKVDLSAISCPYWLEDVKVFTLKYGWKNYWFECHSQFLP